MNAAILLHLDESWTLIEEDRVRTVREYPRLAAPTLVVTDFGGAVSGISTIHENKHYAEALIGRRLRDDNAIENEEARILIHHGIPVPVGRHFTPPCRCPSGGVSSPGSPRSRNIVW